jgi:hypothetical protein
MDGWMQCWIGSLVVWPRIILIGAFRYLYHGWVGKAMNDRIELEWKSISSYSSLLALSASGPVSFHIYTWMDEWVIAWDRKRFLNYCFLLVRVHAPFQFCVGERSRWGGGVQRMIGREVGRLSGCRRNDSIATPYNN